MIGCLMLFNKEADTTLYHSLHVTYICKFQLEIYVDTLALLVVLIYEGSFKFE